MRFRTVLAFLIVAAMVYFIGFPSTPEWTGHVVEGVKEKTAEIELPKIDSLPPSLPTLNDLLQKGMKLQKGVKETNESNLSDAPSYADENIAIYFCGVANCATALQTLIEQHTVMDCALYDVSIPEIRELLRKKSEEGNARLVVDNEATEKDRALDFAKRGRKGGLMHNKFCIFDHHTVFMGSFNPTKGKADENNVVIIRSPELAENYQAEFDELWNGEFGKGSPTPHPVIQFGSSTLENFFCPEDWCANAVLGALHDAKESVQFMTYSFTHNAIGDKLVEKHQEGVVVEGIAEKSQKNAYHEFDKLQKTGIDIQWDGQPALLHHKVFIVDGQTVVTGSFNPTANADTQNDENVLIIHNAEIAHAFQQEFDRLFIE